MHTLTLAYETLLCKKARSQWRGRIAASWSNALNAPQKSLQVKGIFRKLEKLDQSQASQVSQVSHRKYSCWTWLVTCCLLINQYDGPRKGYRISVMSQPSYSSNGHILRSNSSWIVAMQGYSPCSRWTWSLCAWCGSLISLMMFDVAALQTYQSFTIFPFVAAKLGPFRSTWAIGKLLKSNWASKPAMHSVWWGTAGEMPSEFA